MLGEAGFARGVRLADDDGFVGAEEEFAVGGGDAFSLIRVRGRSEQEGDKGGGEASACPRRKPKKRFGVSMVWVVAADA